MIRVFQLIFFPFDTWQKIVTNTRNWFKPVLFSALPLLLASAAFEGYALTVWGSRRESFGSAVRLSSEAALRFEAIQVGLNIATLLIGGLLLRGASNGFGFRASFAMCLSLFAYGMMPLFLLRFADAAPGVSTWFCWMIGVVLGLASLYHGVAQVLKPEITRAFGLYLFTSLVLIFLSGLAHFLAVTILHRPH